MHLISNRFYVLSIFVLSFLFSYVDASDGSCPKCVLIRKANAEKAKDQTWVFYEDWLETDEGKAAQKSEITFEDDQESEPDQNKE
jgi:hypothetical protein